MFVFQLPVIDLRLKLKYHESQVINIKDYFSLTCKPCNYRQFFECEDHIWAQSIAQ